MFNTTQSRLGVLVHFLFHVLQLASTLLEQWGKHMVVQGWQQRVAQSCLSLCTRADWREPVGTTIVMYKREASKMSPELGLLRQRVILP